MKYVHLGPDSICVLAPLHPDGLLQPMTWLGFSRTGLTYFAININLSLALQTVVTLLHNPTRHAEELATKHLLDLRRCFAMLNMTYLYSLMVALSSMSFLLPITFTGYHHCPNNSGIFISQRDSCFIHRLRCFLICSPSTFFIRFIFHAS